jgi:outer membrane protein OmpA-like peptidoglycan-associated protein
MKRLLKSTTALVLVSALANPLPALATDQPVPDNPDDVVIPVDGAANISGSAAQTGDAAADQADKAERKAKRKARREAEEKAAAEGPGDPARPSPVSRPSGDIQPKDQQQPGTEGDAATDPNTAADDAAQAEREAEQLTQSDPVADPNRPSPVSRPRDDPQPKPNDTEKSGSEGADPNTAADDAAQAERKAKRKADRQAERARARAEGNLLPSDTDAQADKSNELDQQNRPVAASGAAGGDPEVTTQTVGEGDVRSSAEEVRATAPAAQPQKDDGISDLGKVVLFGLGALAVGKLLSNGDKVVSNTGDRVVVETDDGYRVLKDDDALLRRPGSKVRTETYRDGSTRTMITQADGSRVETIRAADGRVLRRSSFTPDGREFVLFDDTRDVKPVQTSQLPQPPQGGLRYDGTVSGDDLARAMQATQGNPYGRSFSLTQIRTIDAVRRLVPEIAVDNVRFATGSAALRPETAYDLAALGGAIRDTIRRNPAEVFLIEGHTDAIGSAQMNLALSDRRAETVALALTEYFDVPPQNLVVQGYGEADLKVPTYAAEAANRRVAVRRITPLLN